VKTSQKYAFKIKKKKKIYPANILDFSLLWVQRPVGYKQENVNNTNPFSQTHNQYSTKKKIIKLTYL
jgi:hypothetical protein